MRSFKLGVHVTQSLFNRYSSVVCHDRVIISVESPRHCVDAVLVCTRLLVPSPKKKESAERTNMMLKIATLEQTVVKLTGMSNVHSDEVARLRGENGRLRDENGRLQNALGEHTGKQLVLVGDAYQGAPTDDDGGRVRAVATKGAKRRRARSCSCPVGALSPRCTGSGGSLANVLSGLSNCAATLTSLYAAPLPARDPLAGGIYPPHLTSPIPSSLPPT